MERIVLTSPGIGSDHCIRAIADAIMTLDGIVSVNGSAEAKQVTVTYDPKKVSFECIEDTMEEEGYPVVI